MRYGGCEEYVMSVHMRNMWWVLSNYSRGSSPRVSRGPGARGQGSNIISSLASQQAAQRGPAPAQAQPCKHCPYFHAYFGLTILRSYIHHGWSFQLHFSRNLTWLWLYQIFLNWSHQVIDISIWFKKASIHEQSSRDVPYLALEKVLTILCTRVYSQFILLFHCIFIMIKTKCIIGEKVLKRLDTSY